MIAAPQTTTTAEAWIRTTTQTEQGTPPRIEAEDMTEAEKAAYFAGYEEETDQKSWY